VSAHLEAPGLTADWLDAWMAAIGVAVVVPTLHVAWSDDVVPIAVFTWDSDDAIVEAIARALPTTASLDESVIARIRDGHLEFPRNVTLEAYRDRAVLERRERTTHLAASVTDLRTDVDVKSLDHGAFDVSAPRGETLWSRARSCAAAIPSTARDEWLADTLAGRGHRVKLNGLGFDPRRLPSGVHGAGNGNEVFADPVIELLAFCALPLFPTRGNGARVRQRGWRDRATQRGAFKWSAWRPALDCWAMDAFFDLDHPPQGSVVARYASVPYIPRGTQDVRRAYFSERRT
jgi:hypothetical protein